mgnify:FL=1
MNIDLFGNIIQDEIDYTPVVEKKSPFDYVKNIADKKYPDDLSGYIPYITNLAMSQRKDLVVFANELNKYHSLPEKAQFDFYYHALPKKNLFAKWSKRVDIKELEPIKAYFNCSDRVAKEYHKTLKSEDLATIIKWYNDHRGGKNGN